MRTTRAVEASWSVRPRGRVPDAAPTIDPEHGLPAAVPGTVHLDLIAAGLIADLAVDGSEADQAWVAEVDWTYGARLDLGEPADGLHRELVLQGLDTLAAVFLDGDQVLTSTDMFHEHVLDVSARPHAVDLRVDFTAALPEARRREAEQGTLPRPYAVPYNYLRKSACSFGWDWGPTTASCGVWRPVLLRTWRTARFDEVDVRASLIGGVPTLDVAVRCRLDDAGTGGLVATVELDGAEHEVPLRQGAGSLRLTDPALALWWPRSHGDPVLHDVTVRLYRANGADGELLDVDHRRVGFRSVELDQTPDPGRDGRAFSLRLNGQRVWVRGLNWIPDDLHPSRVDAARYRRRLHDAVEAGADLVRVWGGGIVERDEFYDACDELGLLVWQDFLFACAAYSEDDATAADVTEEAAQAIRRLRHRASLVLWCGGNECLEGHEHWGWRDVLGGRPWGETYYRELLPQLVAALDGTRPYLPGSPFHPDPGGDPQDSRAGTVHIWTTWGLVDYQHYEDYRPRFVAEFGYQAPASWPTLVRATGGPPDPASAALQAHQKALGDDKLALGLVRHFPEPVTDPVAWYYATQLLQARAIAVGIGHFRAQYERCSGTVWWQLNDCWPALSWAVVDVAGERRLGWHALRAAYADRIVVLSPGADDVRLTLVNETDTPWVASARVRHVHVLGHDLAEGVHAVTVPARSAVRVAVAEVTGRRVDASVAELVVVDVAGAPRATRASRPDRALARLGPQDLEVSVRATEGGADVDVVARTLVRDLSLLAELRGFGRHVTGQLATLMPGESHTFRVRRPAGQPTEDVGDLADLLWSENRVRSPGLNVVQVLDRR